MLLAPLGTATGAAPAEGVGALSGHLLLKMRAKVLLLPSSHLKQIVSICLKDQCRSWTTSLWPNIYCHVETYEGLRVSAASP